jgi:hypothetical protein
MQSSTVLTDDVPQRHNLRADGEDQVNVLVDAIGHGLTQFEDAVDLVECRQGECKGVGYRQECLCYFFKPKQYKVVQVRR